MKNNQIAEIFKKMGTLLEIKGEIIFKTRAYFKAAENILNLTEDIEELRRQDRLEEISGIGKALHDKIIEFCDTGHITAYEKLIKEIPETLLDIINLPSIGPKKAKLFYDQLKIVDVDSLYKAAQSGDLLKLPGIKEKVVSTIINSIKIFKQGIPRVDIGFASELADEIIIYLKKSRLVKKISVAGSLRRMKETIKDIDILIVSDSPKQVMDLFIKMPQVKNIIAHGLTKSSILTEQNIQVDLRVVDNDIYGSALLYFTGSQSFNINLRHIAKQKKMKVSEYGIFSIEKEKEILIASKTEQDCFKALGLPYIIPELREDILGEKLIDKSKDFKIIKVSDIKGDLHVHSTWSDGRNSIEEMVLAAISLGYQYVAISDHSYKLKIAGGLSSDQLIEKKKEIDALNNKYKNIRILFGVELEIDKEGNLDYNSKILNEFDVIIAAIHTSFSQDFKTITNRLVKACCNKYVNIIAHPTCVHFGKRQPIDVDLKEVARIAVDNNVFLELNCFPIRMDLNSHNAYLCSMQNSKFVINTDAHSVSHLKYIKYGIGIANRACLTKENIINSFNLDKLLKVLRK